MKRKLNLLNDVFSIVIFSTPYVFFQIKSENRNPTKCEIEFRTTHRTTDPSQANYKLTERREHLLAAATAPAINKGLFT